MSAARRADAGLRADLVLEGGGVKGLGLVGVVDALAAAGYTFPRVAGTSAGAVVGSLVAALQRSGEPVGRLAELARSLDYRKLRDRGLLGRLARPLGPVVSVVDGLSLAFESGVFEGEYLRDWLEGTLADLGVRTFGDLRNTEDASPLPEHVYTLVVTASDLSRQRLVRLPWDYPRYGLDPDEQSVADAVRTSASIPFYYEPVTLRSPERGVSTLVDGGVLSSFPIALFDRSDGRPPRWPTFGARLSSRPDGRAHVQAVTGPVSLALALVETLLQATDAQHIDEMCVQMRSVFVDTTGISAVDFAITPEQQQELLDAGAAAARKFLGAWDWDRYLLACREYES